MNVQELLTEWRLTINNEKTSSIAENRDSLVNQDFEKLLIIAESQNVCIKALRNGKTPQELETWLVESNNLLDNKSPLNAIEDGEIEKVYNII